MLNKEVQNSVKAWVEFMLLGFNSKGENGEDSEPISSSSLVKVS